MMTDSAAEDGKPRGLAVAERPRAAVGLSGTVLAVVGLGGGLGALARYGLSRWLPAVDGGFPWPTFVANVVGCLLIGVLAVLTTERAPWLLHPFFGPGVLGGFTTFSAYSGEVDDLLRSGAVPVALAYLVATLVSALLAVLVGKQYTRRITGAFRARKARWS